MNLCVSVGVFLMSTQNFITALCSTLFENVVFSDEEGFLDRIITTDETWFHYYDPETKQQSSQWKNVDSPRSKIDLLEFHAQLNVCHRQ
jgi:hypothetical protein